MSARTKLPPDIDRRPGSQLQATIEQYASALEYAKRKDVHVAPPGDLELRGRTTYYTVTQPGDCGYLADSDAIRRSRRNDSAAQLRAVYARLTVGSESSSFGYCTQAGRPKWVAIGVSCLKCGAYWAKPGAAGGYASDD